ncbi:MAG: hypothetical protein INF43_04245 [Alphaproteobacteria bacterium]|nr:hypothetical protein [Alphaproteobacteria bacterium]
MSKLKASARFGRAIKAETRHVEGQLRYLAVVTCEECGRTEKIPDRRGINCNYHFQAFRKLEWELWDKENRALCPKCQTQTLPSKEKDMTIASQRIETAPQTTASADIRILGMKEPELPAAPSVSLPPKPPQKATFAEKATLAEMYLREYYSQEYKIYKPGASDEQGAEQSGLPLEVFMRIREEDFGPLHNYAGLKEETEAFAQKLGTALQALTVRIDALTKGLQQAETAGLPPKVVDFLAEKRSEVKNFFAQWTAKLNRLQETCERESEQLFEKLQREANGLFLDQNQEEAAKFAEALEQLKLYHEEMTALSAELGEIRSKLPPGV